MYIITGLQSKKIPIYLERAKSMEHGSMKFLVSQSYLSGKYKLKNLGSYVWNIYKCKKIIRKSLSIMPYHAIYPYDIEVNMTTGPSSHRFQWIFWERSIWRKHIKMQLSMYVWRNQCWCWWSSAIKIYTKNNSILWYYGLFFSHVQCSFHKYDIQTTTPPRFQFCQNASSQLQLPEPN